MECEEGEVRGEGVSTDQFPCLIECNEILWSDACKEGGRRRKEGGRRRKEGEGGKEEGREEGGRGRGRGVSE